MKLNPLNLIDFYKADHRSQYPKGTSLVFSNWTPRSTRLVGTDHVVLFGLQYFIKCFLVDLWNSEFFSKPVDEVVDSYSKRMQNAGLDISTEHIRQLHELGHLPIEIWSLPEGSRVPVGVPMFVFWNTHPDFFWITNYIETSLSATLWGPCTSATIANLYKRILKHACKKSGGDMGMVNFQGHDFSFRGMHGIEAAAVSGAGHLTSFCGTDTVPAIDFVENYYGADPSKEMVGGSVPATEHSVMCMGTQQNEIETYRRLIADTYPKGIVSIVSDTWDYWGVWTNILPKLKDDIMGREGTVVIRPDSGDPVKIIVGDPDATPGTPEHKGSFEMAWDLFGGTVNEQGFKVLDSHIGLIYGDSITTDRCKRICEGLIAKGFVPTCVFGIGSFTYQYNTRDTFGFAVKATAGVVDGELREIFKDPKTDNGDKKSAKGLLAVFEDVNGEYWLEQSATWEAVKNCAFQRVFCDGVVENFQTLDQIRKKIEESE